MLGRLFGSPKKRRFEEIKNSLTAKAVDPVSEPTFAQHNAFIRAYVVALGLTVPTHVVGAAFPDKIYPKWDDAIWRKPDSIFDDLAAILAWRQCFGAFADVEEMFEPEGQEGARQALMGVCGNTFPASERAEHLMRRYNAFLTDRAARQELFDKQYIGPSEVETPSVTMIHAWMVNEALGEPDLNPFDDPPAVVGLQLYLSRLSIDATVYFKKRGREILEQHIAAGRP